MSGHRRAANIDKNQPEIVKALRDINGVTVRLSMDDILVGYKGVNYWFEIKEPRHLNKKGEICEYAIKDSQRKLLAKWKGHYKIVWSLKQILDDIGIASQ